MVIFRTPLCNAYMFVVAIPHTGAHILRVYLRNVKSRYAYNYPNQYSANTGFEAHQATEVYFVAVCLAFG